MNLTEIRATLRRRLDAIETKLSAACQRSGRGRADVTLVAVTKSTSAGIAALLPELNVLDLGESRPQELVRKAAVLPPAVRWHMIGHLQRNKIELVLPCVQLLHSVDSLRLLTALDQQAAGPLSVLLEVNASGEASKHGFTPAEVPALVPQLGALRRVHIRGLMTMAALTDNPEEARPTFAALRELRDRLRPQLAAPHTLEHLSMGMTNDYEIAVEEGATLVRIGGALFADLPGESS